MSEYKVRYQATNNIRTLIDAMCIGLDDAYEQYDNVTMDIDNS